MNAVIDEDLLLDYLNGEPRAARALEACAHRSISVVTWLSVMARCPAGLLEPTRGFLRTFERLSIGEAVADEALRLRLASPALAQPRALAWATANVNQLMFVTSRREGLEAAGRNVVLAYDGESAPL
ncbi:hypothetical protein [Mitsuaria sp. GD03876]|uniref:hypothetical protein n=1 Tax=Mitsuaria sp. GD03876 TaxID=2975399 RepID=UPI0024484B51|nr:hypothetical protein [Mitsuaria sp. GD03876]MDH0866487.1 hypothetical protein [Mitsuaria sp. GD03876]